MTQIPRQVVSKTKSMLKYQTTQGERIRKVMDVVAPILMDGNIVFDKAKGFTIAGLTENLFVKLTLPPPDLSPLSAGPQMLPWEWISGYWRLGYAA